MQLLNFKEKKLKEGDISFTLKPVSKSLQTGYIGTAFASTGMDDFQRKMALTDYILTDCIFDLEINGEKYDGEVLAECANLMDEETIKTLSKIYEMACIHLEGITEDDAKK